MQPNFKFLCHPHNHPGFYFVLEFWFSLFAILINAVYEQGGNNKKRLFPPFLLVFFVFPDQTPSKIKIIRQTFSYFKLPIS